MSRRTTLICTPSSGWSSTFPPLRVRSSPSRMTATFWIAPSPASSRCSTARRSSTAATTASTRWKRSGAISKKCANTKRNRPRSLSLKRAPSSCACSPSRAWTRPTAVRCRWKSALSACARRTSPRRNGRSTYSSSRRNSTATRCLRSESSKRALATAYSSTMLTCRCAAASASRSSATMARASQRLSRCSWKRSIPTRARSNSGPRSERRTCRRSSRSTCRSGTWSTRCSTPSATSRLRQRVTVWLRSTLRARTFLRA